MLYRNEPSIIVGKHQNAFAEINHWYVKEKKIKVVRRLSGGGTVFHDSGNLNFCFIRNGKEGSLVDFHKFTQPIIEVLQELGVPAERSGRNDLIINGLKFSGNAEHIYRNRTLHHGTLLFSSHLEILSKALKVCPENFQDKAVKSVRSKVTNIVDYIPGNITMEDFRDCIIQHISTTFPESKNYAFQTDEVTVIMQLVAKKYSVWDWNFAYSPKFSFKNHGTINGDLVEIDLEVDKGVVKHIIVKVNTKVISEASALLMDVPYEEEHIHAQLLQFKSVNASVWIKLFF
jgi:lipoate-protein ligase A